jgi:hypothetical protein
MSNGLSQLRLLLLSQINFLHNQLLLLKGIQAYETSCILVHTLGAFVGFAPREEPMYALVHNLGIKIWLKLDPMHETCGVQCVHMMDGHAP